MEADETEMQAVLTIVESDEHEPRRDSVQEAG
jgi:hypothetical protein